jgi:hypothetical protein
MLSTRRVVKNFATLVAMFVYPVTFHRLGIENCFYIYIYNIHAAIYIYMYIWITCTWELRFYRQYIFYLEAVHILFSANFVTQTLSCVSNAANSCCREQYDERRDRTFCIDTLNAELNPICHFLALLGAHHIFHICRITVKTYQFIIPQDV